MKEFKDKVVVITGAGSGIGEALAQKFSQLEAKVALNDFNERALQETVVRLALPAHRIFQAAFDVSDRAAVFDFADRVLAYFGTVDVVINNAGLAIGACDLADTDLDSFERLMAVNFGGVLYGSKAFLPHLVSRPEAALVNVSSVYGLTGISQCAAYASSKFAVNGLTQSLIQAYRGTSLRVHCVYPGGIKTNITRNALNADERDDFFDQHLKHTPQYAATTIVRGIRKKKSRILIGNEAYGLDFITRLLPIKGSALVNKRIATFYKEIR